MNNTTKTTIPSASVYNSSCCVSDEANKQLRQMLGIEGEMLKNDEKAANVECRSEAVESPVRGTSATRAGILETAQKCVCGQREEDYGSPEDNFQLIARFWELYLGTAVDVTDVANMMILLKVARNAGGSKLDNWIDIAGYAACGGEIEFGK